MKQLLTTFLLLLFSTYLFTQEQTPAVELFFITENAPSSPIITCTLIAQSQCWGIALPLPPQPSNFYLTDDYNYSVYVPTANNMGQESAGFDFITSMGGAPGTGYPDFTYGIYKLIISGSNKYFYLDYRDYRIGYYENYSPPSYGHRIDLWIKYKYDNNSLYYSSTGSELDFHNITNGELLNFWDIKQKGDQQISLFPDYWENCLAATNNGSNHPRLVWGPHYHYPPISGTITGYSIYRSAAHISGQPPYNFSLLTTVPPDAYKYVDYSITMGNDYRARSYYVTCKYEDPWDRLIETDPTNTVEVRLVIPSKISIPEAKGNQKFLYKLEQNYPNPFNPVTRIDYTIKIDGLVSLKVYDMLGVEVSTLVYEKKEAGNYSVDFNASKLPSGIYIYTLLSGNYTESKKLILLK